MNTKRFSSLFKQFSFVKLLNIVVILSMLLVSCGTPSPKAPQEEPSSIFGKAHARRNDYVPPEFTHPEPVIGVRPSETGSSSVDNQTPFIIFVENVGQFDQGARFQANSELGTIYLTEDAVWITLLEKPSANGGESVDSQPTTSSTEINDPQILPTPSPSSNNAESNVNGVNLRLSFEGSNRTSKIEGFTPLDSSISFFSGDNPDNWNTDAPAWAGVRYVDFYPGYNLEITSNVDGLSWEFVPNGNSTIQSEASASRLASPIKWLSENRIRLQIEGADSLNLDGNLVQINTVAGSINLPLPELSNSLSANPNSNLTSQPQLEGDVIILPFELPTLDKPTSFNNSEFVAQPISYAETDNISKVIDRKVNSPSTGINSAGQATALPQNSSSSSTINFSKFMVGVVHDIVVDQSGSIYLVGDVTHPNFPTTPGAFHSVGTTSDVFVSKLNSGGTLQFSAVIGGNALTNGYGIAIDNAHNVYITGRTFATNLPVTDGAYDRTNSGSAAFAIKLDSSGTGIVYATYLGNDGVQGFDIAVNSNGEAYVVGQVASSTFPTTVGAFDRTLSGWDGFVTRFNAAGSSLIFSTFLGGSGSDCETGTDIQECSIALGPNNTVYVVGHTRSTDFPTTVGAYDRTFSTNGGNADMFVSKLQANGSSLAYSTYLGGSGNDECFPKCGIDVDGSGNAYVIGTSSGGFPTTSSAYDQSYNGGASDAVVVKLRQGGELAYSTYLGTSGIDIGKGVTVENGLAMTTGDTTSPSFPVTVNAYQLFYGGGPQDAFVTYINEYGSRLTYSTFLGGGGNEWAGGISSTSNGNIVAAGETGSSDFPANGTFANSYVTNFDYAASTVPNMSVISTCGVNGECQPPSSTNAYVLGPINTRTGGLFYQSEDIKVPTLAGELNFFRTYSSLSTDFYSSVLGYGWTHNLDTRLIFPSDLGGEAGYILFKAHTANQYQFADNGDGTYSPTPGVVGSLGQINGQYILTLPSQTVYTFDSTGRLLTRVDAQGYSWEYSYTAGGLLEQVAAEGGTRYLMLAYDTQGRIVSVEDYTGRNIIYAYDGSGDLRSATSLGGGTWQYEYDFAHRLTRVIDPLGNTDEHTEYDVQGRAIRQWDGENNLLGELTYNTDGTTTITDALGNDITHTYDNRQTLVLDEGGAGGATEKFYDKNFRPVGISDADRDTTNLTWSADGANLVQVIDAAGNPTDITYDSLNNPLTVVDALNHQTTYEYAGTLLTSVTDAASGETTYTYTPEGYLESVTDGEGVTTTYGYDTHGQRISMMDEFNNTWQYSYDNLGRLVNITDPLDRVTHNVYDDAGHLTSVTKNYDTNRLINAENEWNIVTEYEYDAAGQQTLVRDTLDRETQYEYDDAGRLEKVIDPELHETENQYDEAGRLSVTIDALQHHTYYFYDEAGRLIETRNEVNGSTKTSYNPDGTVASTTDELYRTTTYTYDELNRVRRVIQPGGGYTENTYDDLGNLIAVRDQIGNVTQYEYDPVGRLIKTIDPALQEVESFYDDAGRLIQTRDARDHATTYEYDEVGRLERVIDQLEGTTTYEYDVLGRRIAVIDANQIRTDYTYDNLDRVVEITTPSGTVYTHYDALGQVASRTDANGNEVEFTYTTLGQVQTQTDGAGGVSTYGYDAAGNRISAQDANLHTSFMEYDELNRLALVRDSSLNETRTVYDAAGQVVTTFDGLNQATHYEYNDLGMQIKVKDPMDHEIQYTYNAAGQMIHMTDANGVVTAYEYFDTGQLKAVIENFQGAAQPDHQTNVRTKYTYDENGNRLTITDGNGRVSHFTYDVLNRLKTERDPLENTWTYTYDAVGNRISMLDPNQLTTYYNYDANRLMGIDYPGSEADVSYEYDSGGRRTGMTDPNGTTTWEYDDANRPVAITDPFETTIQYEYDPAGNRTKIEYAGVQIDYEFNPNNSLSTVSEGSTTTRYQYDAAGRVIAMQRPNGVNTIYTYDASSRLEELKHFIDETNPLASYQYEYDNAGNRIQAVEHLPVLIGPTVRLTVVDSSGNLMIGREVYAFNGDTYTGYHQTTGANGQVEITLPSGDFRFRVDVDGTQFWSGRENHCTIGRCSNLLVTIPTPVTILVNDSDGNLRADIPVYAFIGDQYTGHHGITNAEGALMLRLPEGEYRFRADVNSTQFWSQDACAVPTCGITPITVTLPLTVTVLDNVGMPHAGIEVYAFNNTVYSGRHAATDENGQVQMTLLAGDYRFRADFNGTQFWSGTENHCTVPDCKEAAIAIMLPLVVTVSGTDGSPQQGIPVYAFNGTTFTNYQGITDVDGRVNFTMPAGNYHFRADLNGTQFWSDPSSSSGQNHCSVPDCTGAQITLSSPTIIAVTDTGNAPRAGVPVYAFNGATYTGYHGITDANGESSLTLPLGSYRFRADYNGTQFWSGTSNHCDVPGCSSASVIVTNSLLVTIQDTEGAPRAGVSVYAFNGTAYTGYNATTDENGEATFTLPQGSYRFRADYNGTQFWSGAQNHCDVPGCSAASVTVTNGVQVMVTDTENTPRAGVIIYVFNGTTYTGYNATTNTDGQVNVTLPQGSYRFRADYNGAQFWSGADNHCDVPGCSSAGVTVTNGLLVTVQDTEGMPKAELRVYAFNGTTYTGFNATTNANGQVTFTLPQGSYRFRADLNGTQFWSGAGNHCTVPGCGSANVTVTNPVTLAVHDTDELAKPGIMVYAFNGTTYTGYSAATNANGEAVFTMPLGTYRFRADLNGTQFWSGASNHCTLPGCDSADVTITIPVTLTVQIADGTPQSGVKVYAFNGTTYTGYSATTNASGMATFTLPQGNYRFRADYSGAQYWSGAGNHCSVPGCLSLTVVVGPQPAATATTPPTVTPTHTEIPPTPEPAATAEPTATETPIPTETPLARLFGNVSFVSFIQPQPLYDAEMGTGIGLVGEYFDNSMDINGTPLYTRLDPEVNFDWRDASPADGVPDNFTVRWSGQIEAPTSGEYVFGTMVDEHVRVWIDGQIYIDDWNPPQDLWREGPAINLVGGQKYDIQFDFMDIDGWAHASLQWDTPSGTWFKPVPMQYLYPPATNTNVTVINADGVPQRDLTVHVFDETTDIGVSSVTNVNGQVSFALPVGSYRFRADKNGAQYWSGSTNHCDVPGCNQVEIDIPTQYDSVSMDEFDSTTLDSAWTWTESRVGPSWSLTNNPGSFQFTLPPQGLGNNTYTNLRRNDMGTGDFAIETVFNVYRNDTNDGGNYSSGLKVDFLGNENLSVFVSEDHIITFDGGCYFQDWIPATLFQPTLPVFVRLEKTGTRYTFYYKENAGDHWAYLVSCTNSAVVSQVGIFGETYSTVTSDMTSTMEYFRLARTASSDVIVTATNTYGDPQQDLNISVFDSDTDVGIHGVTDENGNVVFTLPNGSYRFRADANPQGSGTGGTQFWWSGEVNHCDVPGCNYVGITVPKLTTISVGVHDGNGVLADVTVYAFNGTTDSGYHQVTNENGEAIFLLPDGENYRFRVDYTSPGTGNSVSFWNSLPEVCNIPDCTNAEITVATNPVTVIVMDTNYARKEGLIVYAFDETTYTGYQLTTDVDGLVTFNLPDGNYRFRADSDGTQFWSGQANHCAVPGCDQVEITVTIPMLLKVFANHGGPIEGVTVYAFDGNQDTGYQKVTDENGDAYFALPLGGQYHFRANYTASGAGNSVQFRNTDWEQVACIFPVCNYAEIVVTRNPVTVTVLDTDSMPKEGLNVFVFDGDQNTGIYLPTDLNGQVTFTLPYGTYRFRTELNGVPFWSGAENHCDPNAECEPPVITVVKPVIVEVKSQPGTPYPNLPVYVFDGTTYTGRHATTDANGRVIFQLPQGNYHFRADYDGVQFWNSTENDCAVPGCGSATITLPGGFMTEPVTIDYTYDPLYRLTDADYSTGDTYNYTYDAVGNRLTQDKMQGGVSSTDTYTYDIANRLRDLNGVPYTWDANGNLLADGTNTYAYDSANRLTSFNGTDTYTYNGQGDRLSQNGVNYTLDLNSGLTQVLSDGTTNYTYGLGRISQVNTGTQNTDYFLGDALGSTRQLTDPTGAITLAQSYDPYGVVTATVQKTDTSTQYGFTGEQADPSGLIYLRARYYASDTGRFISRDMWGGNYNRPLSLNRWNYGYSNPIKYTDPSGHVSINCGPDGPNSRNLTDWLVREMTTQSNDWPVWPGIGTVTTTSNWLVDSAARQIARTAWDKVSKGSEVTEEGIAWIARELAVAGGSRAIGYVWWKEMVKDGARWDFKDQIASKPGKSIMLCGFESCDWYEYSMPGNIFYGYVGRVAGFTEAEIRAGAVYAQQTDPENNPDTNDWKPWWSPIGLDQATDEAAITVGFQVYNMTHGSSNAELVKNAFKTVLQQYKSSLDTGLEPIEPYIVKYPIGPDGPAFPLGTFDGRNGIGFFGR